MELTPSGRLHEAIALYEQLNSMVDASLGEQNSRLARLAVKAGRRMNRLGAAAFKWEKQHHYAHTSYPNTSFQGRDKFLAILAQGQIPRRSFSGGWY